jgi:Uncharacterized protein conserved in bacteria (DUF2219)
MTGIGFDYGRIKANYSYVIRTRQYKTQQHEQIYGAINIFWIY